MESHRKLPCQGTQFIEATARALAVCLLSCSTPSNPHNSAWLCRPRELRLALAGGSRSSGIAFRSPARDFLNPSWAPNKNGCF